MAERSKNGALAAARRKLLTRLLEKSGTDLSAGRAPAEPVRGEGALSFAQERLWFLDQLHPDSPVYNISRALRLTGRLDADALERAGNEIVRRHEILRATFPSVNGKPVQTAAAELPIALQPIELSGLPTKRRWAAMARLLNSEAAAPFDLARGPLIKMRLIKRAKNDHLLLLVLHQMICDGWSISLLLRELGKLYSVFVKNQTVVLEPPITYSQYAERQRSSLQEERLQSQLAYWKNRLSGSAAALALPSDHPRPKVQTFRGARFPFTISSKLVRALRRCGSEEGATLFMTLMAAFNVLLSRYSNQEDISVGFPVANRRDADTEDLIGAFVNTLVLRTDLSGKPTFRELLRRVRTHCQDALARRDLPFEKLVEERQGERDLSRNPLFQVMFAYQNHPAAEFKVPGVRAELVELAGATAKFDLTLTLSECGRGLRGFFEYSTDLFEEPTIERLARHFITLLCGIAAHPERSIEELPLLSKDERARILVQWNRTAAGYAKDRCMHELFELQAKRTPAACAVECAGASVTYDELNRRANQLACYLRELGIGPDEPVGICLERSVDMVIVLLAILKAGGAYLPLDPAYPPDRLRFMLADARVSLLITRGNLVEEGRWTSVLSEVEGIENRYLQSSILSPRPKVVCLDRDAPLFKQQSAKNLNVRIDSENLAYVIYTSGSSGAPKGVAIEHRNAVAFLYWAKQVFSAEQLAGVLASTSICFDLSVFEIFAPLSWGGRVILAPNVLALQDSAALGKVTLINTVPSALEELLDLGGLPPSTRTVNLAGESLKTELVRRIYDTGRVEKVYDLYGPSETTTYSTFTLRRGEGKATIGRPIANTKIYLLDGALQPVPIGVAGEIFIGGAGVARGYLNRPELTAEKFLRNPFSRDPKARLYRSGDLARYDSAGNVEYLGRIDNQVKIRGFRIELGEIEGALERHPAIRESVVVARKERAAPSANSDNLKSKIQNPKFDSQLVAYVTAKDGSPPAARELRSFLRETLPANMIPAAFVALDALPLTANGKIDRRRLPAPDIQMIESAGASIAPRTESEELVAQVWRDVLNRDRLGVHDNFFELGGHSLLAARIVGRLRAHFNADLALRTVFELPTVALLAAEIDRLRRNRRGVNISPIVAAPRDHRIPLSFAQRRLWFLHKMDSDLTAYNMPVSHRVRGPLNIATLQEAINTIIRRHEVLRTAIAEIDGEPVQQIRPMAHFELPVVDLRRLSLHQAEKEALRIFNADARQPFDCHQAPLMRAKLLRLGAEDQLLILNFHHLISDGASLAVFYRELKIFYSTILAGKPAALPALAVQYADFVLWQRDWLSDPASVSQTRYWKARLGINLQSLDLPTDYERPTAQAYRGARIAQRLSKELSEALKQLSRRQGVTLFMTLLAALKILLSRLGGQKDVIVGATIAGRNRPELEGLIGFFINALALRTDLSGNPAFTDLLARVRATCLDAYTHQDLPFERVVEEINPERDLGRNPIFQVLFNMADISARALKLAGCETVRLSQAAPGAKFDLVVHAPEVDGCLELTLVYNADLFSEKRMAALLDQWLSLLNQIAADPAKPIDQFSLVTPSAQVCLPDPSARLDETWLAPIHSLIACQAEKAPEKAAVIGADESWTYRELDGVSNRLAGLLSGKNINPGDVVAIYAHRDPTLAVAILAALKAGAVFVILDPAYPAPRLIDYVRIARPKGWLRMAGAGALPRQLSEFLQTGEIRCLVDLPCAKKEMAHLLERQSGGAPEIKLAADDPAYIAFTSGSTGEPKGVWCRHGPITHFLPWQQKAFVLRSSDRYALLSGLGYNHLQRELFTALASGASLFIPTNEQLQNPEQLNDWLRRCKISILHLTPALGRLLRTAKGRRLPSVRRIFFGGDLLTRHDVDEARQSAPKAKLVSFYGATETQRAVGYFTITETSLASGAGAKQTVPVGKGIKDVQLILLNAAGQLAGIGERAEIYARSPHLATAYVGDDALTESNFVVNSFTGEKRDRLYRTGEVGRYLPDGNVEWAGRRDRRVSIRGFRVELVEVESVLRQCAGVRQAAVIAREFTGDAAAQESRLIAYVEADPGAVLDVDTLRAFMSAWLPHYMVPAYFHFLESLPLNPNGKVDYGALPAVDFNRQGAGRFEAPQNAVEEELSKILASLLGLKRVGRHDNFFHLGGHSLLAAQAAARVRDALRVNLDLRAFLQAPTVAALAERIEAVKNSRDGSAVDEREEIEL